MSLIRQWFGPSREEVWRKLSTDVHGRYVDGGFWKGDKVEVTHGEWTLTLDTFTVSTGKATLVFTRMRAPYVNPDGFRFTVYRRSAFSGIATWLGAQDIEIGIAPFDDAFVIKATDEARMRRLLQNERIRDLVASQPEIKLTVKDDEGCFGRDFPDGVDELEFAVLGVVKDTERLKRVFELFAVTLDELCDMGSAYRRAPDLPR